MLSRPAPSTSCGCTSSTRAWTSSRCRRSRIRSEELYTQLHRRRCYRAGGTPFAFWRLTANDLGHPSGGSRLDPKAHGQNGLQLLDRIGLWQESGFFDQERSHSVGNFRFGRIEDFQFGFAGHCLPRQFQSLLAALVKFHVHEENVDGVLPIEDGKCLLRGGRGKCLMSLIPKVGLSEYADLLLILD